jgi:hypothetical protein
MSGTVYESGSLTTEGLGYEKQGPAAAGPRSAFVKSGGVELDVFKIDQSGAGPGSHGNSIASGAAGVGAVEVQLAKAASGENGLVGHDGDDSLRPLKENIGPDAGGLLIDIGGVEGVVAEGKEIEDTCAEDEGDARVLAQGLDKAGLNLLAGGIGAVDDTADTVGGFFGDVEEVVTGAVEGDIEAVHEDFLDIGGTELSEMSYGNAGSAVVSSLPNILSK